MLKKRYSDKYDVLQATRMRIRNIFENNERVQFSISGGKDSAVLNDILFRMCESGEIDKSKLVIDFIDEECIWDETIETAQYERGQWLSIGVEFRYWCVEVVHFSCLDTLVEEERFICWDRYAKDVWVRKMPKYALTDHPCLNKRHDTMQMFMEKLNADRTCLIGMRCAESFRRTFAIANQHMVDNGTHQHQYPIYDWQDDDIWLYIRQNDIHLPSLSCYMDKWRYGDSKKQMRLAVATSLDNIKNFNIILETRHSLYERLEKRLPNIYLAYLYHDTRIFRHSNRNKEVREDSGIEYDIDFYRNETMKTIREPSKAPSPLMLKIYERIRNIILNNYQWMDLSCWKQAYGIVTAGDPKGRSTLMLINDIGVRKKEVADKL